MIINYLSAINVLDQHFGHVTFQDAFGFKLIICGLHCILGDSHKQTLPIPLEIPLLLHSTERFKILVAMLVGFDSFFHKSNLVPKSTKDYNPSKPRLRKDILVHLWGVVICMT